MQKVLVVGISESGFCAARLLLAMNKSVFLFDDQLKGQTLVKARELVGQGCFLLRRREDVQAAELDLAVVSPSIAPGHPILELMAERGVPVISEIELAYRYCLGDVLAVTGTNGKSTTVGLLGRMLSEDGRKSVVCGNYGNAFSGEVLKDCSAFVVEVSSYQLEHVDRFRPKIAALLNIAEDHLMRHKTMENYLAQKLRVFSNMREGDVAVLNADDPVVVRAAEVIPAQLCWFSAEGRVKRGCDIRSGFICFNGRRVCRVEANHLKGIHNLANVLCAVAMAKLYGVTNAAIKRALSEFYGIRHRMELIGVFKGVEIYNDSKATNIDSAQKAISCFPESKFIRNRVYLILGGREKGEDFKKLFSAMPPHFFCILTGEATENLVRSAEALGYRSWEAVPKFEQAISTAFARCVSGDVLLFSPACPSFDLFDNFEQRGERFTEIVKELTRSQL